MNRGKATEEEKNLLMARFEALLSMGWGSLTVTVENHRMVKLPLTFSETPDTFKKLYAGVEKLKENS